MNTAYMTLTDNGIYNANGWGVLVGPDVETHVVDGNHWIILEMANVSRSIDYPFPRHE